MKHTTKKITSILLVLTMIFSCLAFVSCISINDDLKMKEAYLRQFGIEGVDAEDVVIDYDGGNYLGARIVMLDAEWHDREMWEETIDDITIQYYDKNRILLYTFGKFYTLTEAKSYLMISEKKLKSIADDFSSKVTHYRGTCDSFDFEECIILNDFVEINGQMPRDNIVYLELDIRLCKDNEGYETFDIVKYLGPDIIKQRKNKIYADDKYQAFSLYVHNAGYENLLDIFEILSKIPGVLRVGYYYDIFDIGAQIANDTYYSHYRAWGHNSIEIEKVWDFTTVR